jgi:hypothetical protein
MSTDPIPFRLVPTDATFRLTGETDAASRRRKVSDTTARFAGSYYQGCDHTIGADVLCAEVETAEQQEAKYLAQRAAERQAERDRMEAFAKHVQAVAKALGGTCEVTRDQDDSASPRQPTRFQRITLPNGQGAVAIHHEMTYGSTAWKRLELHGVMPNGNAYSSESITVAADRDPVAIAKEITKRLLPIYFPALVIAREREEKARKDQEESDATRRTLAKAPGADRRQASHGNVSGEGWSARYWGASVNVEAQDLTPAQAVALIAALQRIRAKA